MKAKVLKIDDCDFGKTLENPWAEDQTSQSKGNQLIDIHWKD